MNIKDFIHKMLHFVYLKDTLEQVLNYDNNVTVAQHAVVTPKGGLPRASLTTSNTNWQFEVMACLSAVVALKQDDSFRPFDFEVFSDYFEA